MPQRSDLSPEWQALVSALEVGAAQLVRRLSALAQHGQIGPDAQRMMSDWVARLENALAQIPQE